MKTVLWGTLLALHFVVSSCASMGGMGGGGSPVSGNENGSVPINEEEAIKYKQEIVRCNKTGGSRVVKIEGQLRCF